MKACWCVLAGTKACLNCPNNTTVLSDPYFPRENYKTYVDIYNPKREWKKRVHSEYLLITRF